MAVFLALFGRQVRKGAESLRSVGLVVECDLVEEVPPACRADVALAAMAEWAAVESSLPANGHGLASEAPCDLGRSPLP